MTRLSYGQALEELQQELLSMGAAVGKQIHEAIEALKRRDVAAAEAVIARDAEIDRMRYEVEERCVGLFATQNPMARDLRTVTSALIISNELERMGDYAEGICKVAVKLDQEPPLKPLIDIPPMAEIARDMLNRCMQAFAGRDIAAAERVWNDDDQLDELYQQILRELLGYMIEDPKSISRATYLLWVAHNLERIGDRVSNIAERIIYMATGRLEIQAAAP
jgi:phosphate transport system protein